MLSNRHIQDVRPQATAHLAKTMSYLQLSSAELEAALLKEIDQNPALELVDELRCPECGRRLHRLPCPSCAAPSADGAAVVLLSPRQATPYPSPSEDGAEGPATGLP